MTVKKVILPFIYILCTLIIISLGLSRAGILPEINFSEIISVGSLKIDSVSSNSEIINQLIQSNSSSADLIVPDEINALWLDIAEDFDFASGSSVTDIKRVISDDLIFYKNFVPNAYFIKPDAGVFDALTDENGNPFDILAFLLESINVENYKSFIVFDDTFLFDKNGNPTFEHIEKYLKMYEIDGILISSDYILSENAILEVAEFLRPKMKLLYPEVCFGFEVQSDKEAQFANESTISLFEKNLIDFAYVDLLTTTADENYPFSSVAMWWSYFADYYNIPLYCEHRLDKIFSDDSQWAYSNEINLQLKDLYGINSFDGSCYFNASSLKRKKALARDLSIFLNDVAGTNQDDFFVKSLSIDNNKVYFSAETNSDNMLLFCNDESVRIKENTFDGSYVLSPGLNTFRFRGNAAKYDFDIFNNRSLIYSYSPSENYLLSETNSFVCSAVCPINSVVYAVFNGNSYLMSENTNNSTSDIPNGYCVYSVDINVSNKYISSNQLSILCICKNFVQSVDCCDILTDNTKIVTEKNDDTYTYNISPYNDNGKGTALMCELKSEKTEIISEVDDYDTYHPYNSTLLKGTIDYIENINVSTGGYIRYELKSGLNVYANDAVLITDGYILPDNNVKMLKYDPIKESLQFSVDWLSPITLTLDDLDFSVGYEQFSFNIAEFSAKYIDLNFYYCSVIDYIETLDLSASELFSSFELIDSNESMSTIRLYFRTAGMFFGYEIIKNDDGNVEIIFNKLSSELNGKVVMLDAGHGGISMVGTALNDNSTSESQITLSIAHKTKTYLESKGITVLLTRTSDSPLSLSERTDLCEKLKPDLFVSIHCDGSASELESGTHTFYYSPFSQPLANKIHTRMVQTYGEDIYVEADANYFRIDRKIKYYPFYVTRVDNCPSVLIETGFLTNYVEGNVLANPINQELIANAISLGICDYFSSLRIN